MWYGTQENLIRGAFNYGKNRFFKTVLVSYSAFTSQTTHSTSRGLPVWISSPLSELSSGKNTWELREQTEERGFHGSLLCSTIRQKKKILFYSEKRQFWWGRSLRQAKKWLRDCVLHSASLLCCKRDMCLCKCLSVWYSCSADAEGNVYGGRFLLIPPCPLRHYPGPASLMHTAAQLCVPCTASYRRS